MQGSSRQRAARRPAERCALVSRARFRVRQASWRATTYLRPGGRAVVGALRHLARRAFHATLPLPSLPALSYPPAPTLCPARVDNANDLLLTLNYLTDTTPAATAAQIRHHMTMQRGGLISCQEPGGSPKLHSAAHARLRLRSLPA